VIETVHPDEPREQVESIGRDPVGEPERAPQRGRDDDISLGPLACRRGERRDGEPDVERPFRAPGNVRVRGVEIPLTAVAGGLGTGIAFVVVTVLNVGTLITGGLWLTFGAAVYVGYRRRQGLTLTETRKVVMPKPIVEHEVEYQSVLVAFEDGQYSGEAVSTAVKLAARRRRGIHVLVTITVPANAPIGAAMPEAERNAQAAVDSARVRGGRRVTGHYEKVRAGEAGRRIVGEAREIDAAAVVMTIPPRRTGSSIFGRTLETVLSERPCRVIIDSSRPEEPASARAGAPA